VDRFQPLGQLRGQRARCRHAGQIAFDVGQKNRNANRREAIGQQLQRDGLAGSRGAGHEPVTVRHRGEKLDVLSGRGCRDGQTIAAPGTILRLAGGDSQMLHQQFGELRAFAFFFVLEIHEDVAAFGGFARNRVGPASDIVRRVSLVT
jgi:hypothetical protein